MKVINYSNEHIDAEFLVSKEVCITLTGWEACSIFIPKEDALKIFKEIINTIQDE